MPVELLGDEQKQRALNVGNSTPFQYFRAAWLLAEQKLLPPETRGMFPLVPQKPCGECPPADVKTANKWLSDKDASGDWFTPLLRGWLAARA